MAGAAGGVGAPTRRTDQEVHRWLWRFIALLTGALPVFAFPAPALWWWAFFALVPALLIVARAPTRRSTLVRSWWVAAGYAIAATYWTLPNVGPALVLIGFGLGLLYVPWGWLTWELMNKQINARQAVAAVVVIPSAWLAAEYARSWSALGGPWAVYGTSQWNDRDFLALASVGGVWLVSFALVAINVGISIALFRGATRRGRLTSLALVASIAVAGFSFGALRNLPHAPYSFTVAMVQPGPGLDRVERFDAEISETAEVARLHPQLVVWGETSVSFDVRSRPVLLARIESLSRTLGADLLVNEDARVASEGGIFKSALLVDSHGIISVYDKMRLVPFGEYIPFRPVLSWLSDISRAAKVNRGRGRSLVAMSTGYRLPWVGPLICFEETFPDMSRKLVAGHGADLLVYQTSDSTFQGSWELQQHASLAALRAVETGVPAVHAALTGDSAVFDATGRELAWFPQNEHGAFVVHIPMATEITFFDREGDWVPDASLAALVLAAAGVAWRGVRTRQLAG